MLLMSGREEESLIHCGQSACVSVFGMCLPHLGVAQCSHVISMSKLAEHVV